MNKSESKYFNTATKMNLALISLLKKKPFEYITVSEICKTAGVNRSTFYLHYETIGDLLIETTRYLLDDFLSALEQSVEFERSSGVDAEQEKIRYLQLRNDDLENANAHRTTLVYWMIVVVSAWLVITAGIVITQLCLNQLSDTVLCTLLTTTTVNVLGLAVIVLRGLFRDKSTKK